MEEMFICVFIISIQINLFINALAEYEKGVCKKINTDGHLWLDCCPGFMQNKHKCDDCPNGTTGEQCQVDCPNNYYGLRCHGKCDCGLNETCDKGIGCKGLTGFGSTVIIGSQNNESKIASFSTVTIAVIIGIAVLLLGLSLIVCSSVVATPCLLKNKVRFRSRSKELTAQEDDDNLYSEIRESMMIRPMTVYGRHLSVLCTSYNNPVDEYHHLSRKSSDNMSIGKNYRIVVTDSTCVYIDHVDELVSKDNKAQPKPCNNAFVDKKDKTKTNIEKMSSDNETLEDRNKELPTTDCNFKDESDSYFLAQYSGIDECKNVEDCKYMDTEPDESVYTQVWKNKENGYNSISLVDGIEYTDLMKIESDTVTLCDLVSIEFDAFSALQNDKYNGCTN